MDGSVVRALGNKHYDYVVLQERGGDLICAFGPASCKDAETSLGVLSRAALMHGAKPLLLGTYQALPLASKALVEAETAAATHLSIPYIAVSNHFLTATNSTPSAQWLYADGMHPGHDLILLEAALLYHHLFGEFPNGESFTVFAPMYKPDAKFSTPLQTNQNTSVHGVSSAHAYSANNISSVLKIAADSSP